MSSYYYLTNKGLFLKEIDDDYCKLIDINNRTITIKYSELSQYGLSVILHTDISIKTTISTHYLKQHNLEESKTIDYNGYITLENKEVFIRKSQEIELLYYQYLCNEPLNNYNYVFLEKLADLNFSRADGSINETDFNNELSKFDDPYLTSIKHHEIVLNLSEFIQSKLIHAIYRFKQSVSTALEILLEKEEDLSQYNDFRITSRKVDSFSYEIEDCVKAIVSSLDGTSKLLDCSRKVINNQTPHLSSLTHAKLTKKDKIHDKDLHNKLSSLYNQLNSNYFFNLRDDLTHNKSLYEVRHIIYAGRKTKCVENKDLKYVNALLKDFPYNRIDIFNDFYTKQNCIFTFLLDNLKIVYELFDTTLDLLLKDIQEKLKQSSLKNNKLAFRYKTYIKGKTEDMFEYKQIT